MIATITSSFRCSLLCAVLTTASLLLALNPAQATDLKAEKEVDKTQAFVGDTLTYTIKVSVVRFANPTNATLTDNLPTGLRQVSATWTKSGGGSGSCSATGQMINCMLGTFNATDSATVTVKVIAETEGTVTNTATVTGSEPDPDPDNNTSDEVTTVITVRTTGVDVQVSITEYRASKPGFDVITDASRQPLGTAYAYQIIARNEGPETADNVTIRHPIPAFFDALNRGHHIATPPGLMMRESLCEVSSDADITCSLSEGVLTCTKETMLPDEEFAAICVESHPVPNGTYPIEADITAESPEDYAPENNMQSVMLEFTNGRTSQVVNLTDEDADVAVQQADPIRVPSLTATPAACLFLTIDATLCFIEDQFSTEIGWTDAVNSGEVRAVLNGTLDLGSQFVVLTDVTGIPEILLSAPVDPSQPGLTFFNNTSDDIQIQNLLPMTGDQPTIMSPKSFWQFLPGDDETIVIEITDSIGRIIDIMPDRLSAFFTLDDVPGKTQAIQITGFDAFGAPLEPTIVTATEAETELPTHVTLYPNYPNPFNPSTTIRFELPTRENVRLTVFDVTGREVGRLVDGALEAGLHEVPFHAGDLPSGIYLFRLTTPEGSRSQTSMLLK